MGMDEGMNMVMSMNMSMRHGHEKAAPRNRAERACEKVHRCIPHATPTASHSPQKAESSQMPDEPKQKRERTEHARVKRPKRENVL